MGVDVGIRIFASLAQLVERVAVNHKVIGSSPVGSDILIFITI